MKYENIPSLLESVQRHTSAWFASLDSRPACATASAEELQKMLGGPLPDEGIAPATVDGILANAGTKGTAATAGPRFFGFVVGGSLPAALAADWLVSAWDQNGGVYVMSPLVSVIEQITGSWLRELGGLSPTMSYGFVTGCQMANFTGLAAARHRVLRNAGWDVESDGLFGAPPIDVVVNEEAHYTISMALRLLGLGSNRVRRIPTDSQGRMRADSLAAALRAQKGPCIVCAQAGNVNTGAIDPLREIAESAKECGAWLHVDGAFGFWAAASPERAHLVRGVESADSVATDAHKWLNVPYDCGIVFCADEAAHRSAMSLGAAYIVATGGQRDPRVCAGRVSARQGGPGIRGYAIPWTPGARRNDRTQLPPGEPVFYRFAGRGIRSAQRSGAQPGSGFLRHSGTNSAHHRGGAAGGCLLVRRNGVERPDCNAHQREQLVNHRRGCREEHRGDPASRAETRPMRFKSLRRVLGL